MPDRRQVCSFGQLHAEFLRLPPVSEWQDVLFLCLEEAVGGGPGLSQKLRQGHVFDDAATVWKLELDTASLKNIEPRIDRCRGPILITTQNPSELIERVVDPRPIEVPIQIVPGRGVSPGKGPGEAYLDSVNEFAIQGTFQEFVAGVGPPMPTDVRGEEFRDPVQAPFEGPPRRLYRGTRPRHPDKSA